MMTCFRCLFPFLFFIRIEMQSESRGHFTDVWAVQINGTVNDAQNIASKYGFIYVNEVRLEITANNNDLIENLA